MFELLDPAYLPLLASLCGHHHHQLAAIGGRFAEKSNLLSIRRPHWIRVLGRMSREPGCCIAINILDVDVPADAVRSVPRKRDFPPVRGKGRLQFAALQRGVLLDHRWPVGLRAMGLPPGCSDSPNHKERKSYAKRKPLHTVFVAACDPFQFQRNRRRVRPLAWLFRQLPSFAISCRVSSHTIEISDTFCTGERTDSTATVAATR